MNPSKELIKKLQEAEEQEVIKYKKAINELVKPLHNQILFSAKSIYEDIDEQPKLIFTIKVLEQKENEEVFSTHSIQISFHSSKTDKQDKILKIIKAKDLRVIYSSSKIESSELLGFIGDNVYFNCDSSLYSDVSQIISNMFSSFPQTNSMENWTSVGKTRSEFSQSKLLREVYIHNSLIYKQIVPQIIKQIEENRTNPHNFQSFKSLENKLQNDFLLKNLTNSQIKNKKPKI